MKRQNESLAVCLPSNYKEKRTVLAEIHHWLREVLPENKPFEIKVIPLRKGSKAKSGIKNHPVKGDKDEVHSGKK